MFKDKQGDATPETTTKRESPMTDILDQVIEVAEEFLKNAKDLKEKMGSGEHKKIQVKRCKRSSMSLSDELIEMRKALK